MEFILFINVKNCWHLNSIFKIGEFLNLNIYVQVNILFSWADEHIMSRPGFSEFQKSMCKFVPNFIQRCVRDDP